MQGTAEELRTNSLATFSYGLLHMDTAETYIYQHCADTGCRQEDLSRAIEVDDESELREYMLLTLLDDDLFYFRLLESSLLTSGLVPNLIVNDFT